MEEEFSNGQPVWPERNRQHRPVEQQKLIDNLLAQLERLEVKTRPSEGPSSQIEKHDASLDALNVAGRLVRAVAGWAILHQTGVALNGGDNRIHRRLQSTSSVAEFVEQDAFLNSHKHEKDAAPAARISDKFYMDPIVARRLLGSLLMLNPGGFDDTLAVTAALALQALDFEETQPMLAAAKGTRKIGLTELRLQMRAICFVAFHRANGLTREAALEQVAAGLCVSAHSVATWRERLKSEFGRAAVESEEMHATRMGQMAKAARLNALSGERIEGVHWFEMLYGNGPFNQLIENYKAAKKS